MAKEVSGIELARRAVVKGMGEGVLTMASEIPELPRISTKIFSLDAYLGGGIPMGRITRLIGEFSSGKSTICQLTAASAQHTDRFTYERLSKDKKGNLVRPNGDPGVPMNVLWIDAELTFDPSWARACGIDNSRLHYGAAGSLEQAFNILHLFLRTKEADMVVIDSLAALAPDKELISALEDQHIGISARQNNKALRVITSLFNELAQERLMPPTIILVNQIREKIGVMFGNPETTPGGKGQEFFSSLDIHTRVQALGKAEKDGEDVVSRESNFSITKNKINGVYGKGTFSIYTRNTGMFHKGDTDEPVQAVEWAIRLGILPKTSEKSSYVNMPDGETVQGKDKAIEYLLERPEMYQDVYLRTLQAVREVYA